MSPHAVASSISLPPALVELYRPVAAELAEVERILRRELRSRYPFIDELVRYGCLLGGKRLRPALLLLAARCAGTIQPEHLKLAAVVEMVHTATLVHDDVLDGASTRRHLATVNVRWDDEAAILLGDFLFTHAFELASSLDTTFACRAIGHASKRVCEGELRQKGSRGDFELTERDYLEIVEAKTAELCACSCSLGAYYATAASELQDRLAAYGRLLGIAFQIADDMLDLVGDEHAAGKSLGTDLQKQKPTLPIIRLLQVSSSEDREQLRAILESESESRRLRLLPFIERYQALAYVRERAAEFGGEALEQLADVPDGPAAQVLRRLTGFVVNRSA